MPYLLLRFNEHGVLGVIFEKNLRIWYGMTLYLNMRRFS